ncbi:jg23361, partial [Pararge aegeria aegeria]
AGAGDEGGAHHQQAVAVRGLRHPGRLPGRQGVRQRPAQAGPARGARAAGTGAAHWPLSDFL